MYILFAPEKKFGILPPNHAPVINSICFKGQIALCPTQYMAKIHCDLGFEDITPDELVRVRKARKLKTVVVRAFGGIGDSLWCMPICKMLKSAHPYCAIAVVTEAKNKAAWAGCPWIDNCLEPGSWQHICLELRADEVFDFSGIATIYKQYTEVEPVEATFLIAGIKLSNIHADYRPDIRLKIEEGQEAQKILLDKKINVESEKLITIAVEASTANRSWPYSHSSALARSLSDAGYRVCLIGTTHDLDDTAIAAGLDKLGIVNLCGKTSLRQSWAIISLSDCVVTMNSSPVVVATALGVPTIGLFGTHDPRRIGKHYEKFMGVWGNIKCAPCNEHWTECRHGHPAPCMKSITPDAVHAHIINMMQKYPREKSHVLPIN